MSGTLFSGVSRRPRLRVLANGAPVQGVREAEVYINNYFAANRFNVSIALGPDPQWTALAWSEANSVTIEIDVGFLQDFAGENLDPPWVSLIQGKVDTVVIDPIVSTVRLEGRDFTSLFIETLVEGSFTNQTASEIAANLAARHNLSAAVASTSTPVGRYYGNEYDQITLNQFASATTEWNLLVWLAEQEGFDVWVQDNTLFFQPRPENPSPDLVVYAGLGFGTSNVQSLRMERKLGLAGNVTVTMKSWSSANQTAYVETAAATGVGGIGTPKSYVYLHPNLTPDQLAAQAQRRLNEIMQHERVIEFVMPGELQLTSRSQVALVGTNTAFDQIYSVEAIERRLDYWGGFTQRVRAKNSTVA
ncbi:MAG: hypothetical protein K6U10_10405 [Acidobacteriia bacterium]|nr:phage late control D family protein [Methyloceanibacter sp.]MCL6492218.1 hypothetical protein [Terriglobia bacterium]